MCQRLPRNYTPELYELFLHINPQQTPFDASVTITFHKNEDSDIAYLYVFPNIVIKSITQNNIPLTYDCDYPLLTINRSADQDISSHPITINYTLSPITSECQGFYEYDGNFFTKFEPNHAHRFLPCFDDPIVRSTFSVKIQIPSNLTGLSNMPIETSTTTNDNETIIKFLPTPPICSYLLAVFIGTFSSIEGVTKNGVPVKFYAKKGCEEKMKKYLDAAIHAVNWMEEKTHVKYELPVLQLLSHPGLRTGMENYGLIALRDYSYGYSEYDSLVVMHEVSHLWFGDLVEVKWWNSVWLNEGFAQYFMYLIMDDFPEEHSKDSTAIQTFIENDGLRCFQYFDDERVVVDENEIDLNKRVLKSVIYIKGAFVLKMFHDIVGEDNFFKVCSAWLSTFKNKNGDTDQFIEIVKNTLNIDYSNFFNTWLKKVGFPMLNVVELYNEEDKIVGFRITQESYSGTIYQLKIPIVYEIGGEVKKMDVLMDQKEISTGLEFDWILVNDGVASLCTTIYSKVLFRKLCEANKSGKVDYYNTCLIRYSKMYMSHHYDIDQEILDLCEENFP